MTDKWIQNARPKKCALHKQLGKKCDDHITTGTLRGIVDTPVGNKFRGTAVTAKLKRRANFALNVRK